MTPIERIDARISRLEDRLDELRDLRDEIEQADLGATQAGIVRRLATNPGAVDKLIERLDSDDLVDAADQPAPAKPKRGRPPKPKEGAEAGKSSGPASRERHVRAVLDLLGSGGPRTQPEICRALSIPKGSISQTMKRGEARGWWAKGVGGEPAVGAGPGGPGGAGGGYAHMTAADAATLIDQFEPLCWRLAHQFGRNLPPHELEELAAAARLRLVESARTFDPAKGVAFMTYVYRFCRWAVLAERQRLATRGVHVPSNYDPARVVPQVTNDFELSEGGDTVLDLVAAPEPDDERADWPTDFWERCRAHLSDRQYQCLTLCYRDGLPQVDAAKRFGVTRSAVQQYCKLAVEKLRAAGVFQEYAGVA